MKSNRSPGYQSRLAAVTAERDELRQQVIWCKSLQKVLAKECRDHERLSKWVAKQPCAGMAGPNDWSDCGKCLPCSARAKGEK